ncbi:aminopeptidase [Sedimentibacter sp. MB31-C6]|uniref:aminopeptidase n=1 Tax=Sedimentibacter sp. MB31-C6 TaxID=3109366 RepID=UPI002DDD28D7|nr:aminopeptidase [Sedimentibacter sp. MB36-C1]WSI05225.1 aminopeptidase [Sedimentibacter sp. MB36-C1]
MDRLLFNYADLILQRGVALEKNQILVIETSTDTIDFLRILTKQAYELGAKDVVVHYTDHELTKIRLQHASVETLTDVPNWWIESQTYYGDNDACFLRLISEDPDGLREVDHEKLSLWKKATATPLNELNFKKKENMLKWSAAAVPNKKWAQKVFPNLKEDEAFNELWKSILKSCYVNEQSGLLGWDEHIEDLKNNVVKLNNLNLKTLRFKNKLGTDLEIGICEDGIFAGGICHCPEPDGVIFAPNIPSEEILTTPHRFKVNGTVYNSFPLSYSGNIIDKFYLKFKDGIVVDYNAAIGEEILKGILDTDEGTRRLGEVAFVPYNSPINKMGIIFYNTLFDENASCHLALGAGYTDVIKGKDRSKSALIDKGLNTSALHVDFMFGSEDMECIGTTYDNKEITIFKNGLFII